MGAARDEPGADEDHRRRRNTTQIGAENGEQVEAYTLLSQWPAALDLHLVARTHQNPRGVVASLRSAVQQVALDEPIFDVELMTTRIASFSSDCRFSMGLFAFFAAAAFLLASVGIYGVLACLVGQRTREIGIRIALGAQRADVMRHVVGHGLGVTLSAVIVGCVAARAGSRALQSQLFGITGADLPTYAASSLLLVAAALAACALPARRAAKIEPLIALRAK